MDSSTVRLTVDVIQALHARIWELEQHAYTQLGVTAGKGSYPYRPPPRPETQSGLILFQKWFNDYWKLVFGTQINFEIIQESVKTMSMTEPAMKRNKFIKQFFTEPPVIFDASAGIGGDTVTFLHSFAPKKCIAVEHSTPHGEHPELSRTFRTLKKNVSNFLKAYPDIDPNSIETVPDSIQTFLERTNYSYIDLLFIDPPWSPDGGLTEYTPEEMIEYLNNTVFSITGRWFKAKIVCLKSRFPWDQFSAVMKYLPDYIRLEDIGAQPFKGEYHTHIFLKNEASNEWLDKSKAWYDTYENGTPKEKWMRKTGFKNVKILEDNDEGIPYFPQGKPSDYPGWHHKQRV
jgi:hypothetical protein